MQISTSSLILDGARVRPVVDLDPYPIKTAMIFPDADADMIARHRANLEPAHMRGEEVLLSVQSFVLEVDGRVIVVDTCVGEHKGRAARPMFHERRDTGFLDRLAALGIKPEQVDIVMCTHLHVDHVGWNTRLAGGKWVPTFPNARYVMGRRELAHWDSVDKTESANHGSYRDSVLPIVEAGRADLVDDGHELLSGLTLLPLPGHSPGQLGLDLRRRDGRAVFAGDAIHSPLQLFHPELSTGFDTDKAQARASRQTMLASVADSGAALIPAHFRECCGWKLERHGPGYRKAG